MNLREIPVFPFPRIIDLTKFNVLFRGGLSSMVLFNSYHFTSHINLLPLQINGKIPSQDESPVYLYPDCFYHLLQLAHLLILIQQIVMVDRRPNWAVKEAIAVVDTTPKLLCLFDNLQPLWVYLGLRLFILEIRLVSVFSFNDFFSSLKIYICNFFLILISFSYCLIPLKWG